MAINVTLNNIVTGFNLNKINENFQIIRTALTDALSRSGTTPNTMSADLDMNSQNVLNAGYVTTDHLIVNGYEIGQDIETRGDKGWSPVHTLVPDGDRLVFLLTEYVGGEGLPPTDNLNKYLTEGGYTTDISLATNVIGPPGPLGPGGGDLLSDNNLSDLDNEVASFNNIKQDATDSYTGVVELATNAEGITGTDTTRAMTAAAVKAAIDAALSSLNAVPLGAIIDYSVPTASPPAGYVFPYGQAISRSTYSAYFALVGTTYGSGDGSTTFNVPDIRGRTVAGKDDMGGTSANRLTSPINGDTLGAVGGSESHTLITAELPSHNHLVDPPATLTDVQGNHVHSQTHTDPGFAGMGSWPSGSSNFASPGNINTDAGGAHQHWVDIGAFSSGNTGSGSAHNNMQPTIIMNKILYVGA